MESRGGAMKKIVSLLLAVFLAVLLAGCTQTPKEPDRLFLMKENGKYGFMGRAGKVVIPPQFVDAQNFSEGLAGVRLSKAEHKYGYIDTSGKVVIPPQFDRAGDFSEGLAWVGSWDNIPVFGFIDRIGKMVIPPQFSAFPGDFSEGLAQVQQPDKWGNKWG
jgi:cytochrome c556